MIRRFLPKRSVVCILACIALAACGGKDGASSENAGSGAGSGGGGSSAGTSGGSGVGGGSGSGGGIAGSSGTGGGSGVWRPFNAESPWNTLIEDNPQIDPDSDAMIADLLVSSEFGPQLGVNIPQFSIPLFYAQPGTPRRLVQCRIGGLGFPGMNGMNASAMVPWPEGAAPDHQSDHHLLIIERATETAWDMGQVVDDGDQVTCNVGSTVDLTGSGMRPIAEGNPTWYTSHGSRACGLPLVAGLILREEIDAGAIEHALVIAYPHIRAGTYSPPASTAQARIGDQSIMTRGIPCGGRIQYDPSIDVDSLGLSPAGRAIMVALQRYGAYVGDFSGSISLYAENSPEAKEHWGGGVLSPTELMNRIDLADFRVLQLGTLYYQDNGG